jgi:hypothetical protein
LQAIDHASLTAWSPTWCAIVLARGLKIVWSAPRSRISLSWFFSIVSRISSSLIAGYGGGALPSLNAAFCASRQVSCCGGAVV